MKCYRRGRLCVLVSGFVLLICSESFGQTSIPSNEEIQELASKADEKISGFETAIRTAKPKLDLVDPTLSSNYLHAASQGHAVVSGIRKSGSSAYALVLLIGTLDDLSLDAMTASVDLLIQGSQSGQACCSSLLVPLMTSKNECNDISELLMHATLRLIHAEEDVIQKLPK